MRQHRAQTITNVHQIIRALEIFAKQTVTTIKIVWPTNDVYEERVDRFATVTLRAEMVKYARIDCVKLVAEMI